jgi:hypothetical protein
MRILMRKPTIANPRLTNSKKTNFDNSFLYDFGLLDSYGDERSHTWVYDKKAQERFHIPITYMSKDEEGTKHYRLKQQAHDYVYENYYLNNECKFFVTTELEQVNRPFISYIDGEEKVFYTMDVCVIRFDDNQIFNIEIDGREHLTPGNMMRDERRHRWLNDRYGVLTHRIDYNEYDNVNFKDIDKFISQPAAINQNYNRTGKGLPTKLTDSEERLRRKKAGRKKDPNNSKN